MPFPLQPVSFKVLVDHHHVMSWLEPPRLSTVLQFVRLIKLNLSETDLLLMVWDHEVNRKMAKYSVVCVCGGHCVKVLVLSVVLSLFRLLERRQWIPDHTILNTSLFCQLVHAKLTCFSHLVSSLQLIVISHKLVLHVAGFRTDAFVWSVSPLPDLFVL